MTSGALPELGPYLGRMVDGGRRFDDPAVGLDRIRLELIDGLFERAGRARELLRAGDPGAARAALDRDVWLALWREAAGRAAEGTVAAITARLERAAAQSAFPSRKLAGAVPDAEDKAVLRGRLEAAGIGLEQRVGSPLDGAVDWADAIRLAAVALEDSWGALEGEVRRELAAFAAVEARVAAWRPSPLPFAVTVAAAVLVGGWLGLVLGGYLARPWWLDGFHRWFWSLPWP